MLIWKVSLSRRMVLKIKKEESFWQLGWTLNLTERNRKYYSLA